MTAAWLLRVVRVGGRNVLVCKPAYSPLVMFDGGQMRLALTCGWAR